MRRTITFLFLFVFAFSLSMYAQDHSFERAPNLPDKIDTRDLSHLEMTSTAYFGDAPSASTYNFSSLPLPAGTPITTIGTTADLMQGGDFDGTGTFYGTVGGTLVSIDKTTGTVTNIASITGVTSGQTVTALGWNAANSTMYLGSTNVTTSELYTINLATAAATLVGAVTNCEGLIALAIDCAGNGYGVDLISNNLIGIDLSTGAGTQIGDLGFDPNYAQDADFEPSTGTLYLAAYDNTAGGQIRTADVTTGASTLVTGIATEITGFGVDETCGPPVGPGPATNPNPPSGTSDVSANLSQVTWDNPAGATESILYWGTDPAALTIVQSGGLNTSFSPPTPLTYLDTYYWKVDESDGTDTTTSPIWSFTVEEDPAIVDIFTEDFEGGLGAWTVTNNGGTCDWQIWPEPWPNAYNTGTGSVLGADADECGSGATVDSYVEMGTGADLTDYQTVSLEFDTDFNQIDADDFGYVQVSVDGGTTWSDVATYNGADYTAEPEVIDISTIAALQSDVRVRFHSIQPGWDWWWIVDNFRIRATDMIPVELATFTAETVNNSVALNWTTATETNNSGFEVERKADGEFQSLGFVEGNGTTTELRSYNFVDDQVTSGTYTYRLKQIDFNGVFEYSDEVVVEVSAPKEFALAQNYPNPFNPSTVIDFSLPVDAKVTLKIFDVLGQEVMTLVNANYDAGTHQVKFNASNLNSGLYIYSIEAQGVNGQAYSSAKKMMLTK